MVALPSYSAGNALNFQPVQNALAQVTAQNNANRQYGLEQQQSARADQSLALQKQQVASSLKSAALDQEKTFATLTGGWAQQALQSGNPQIMQQALDGIKASHPEFGARLQQAGVDPNDPGKALSFLTAEAQGYQNPLDVQLRKAQIAGLQGENALRGKQFTTIGQNVYGQPQYGVVDLNQPNGGVKPIAPLTSADAAGSIGPGQGPTGDDYLKTLPKPMADQVRAIAEGRIPIPGGFALKTPYWQQMMTHVSQYDPTFDSVNYNARSKTRNDFTSGKSAQTLASISTAIGHLGTLDASIDPLGNGAYPALNAAKNAAADYTGNTKQQSALQDFNFAKDAVSKELVKAFRGSGGSLTEIEGFEKLLDSAKSPQALHAAVKKGVELLNSRLDAIGEQYNRGMGRTADPMTFLTPKAQAVWKKLNPDLAPDVGGSPQSAAPSGSPAAPVSPAITHVWDPQTGLHAVGGH